MRWIKCGERLFKLDAVTAVDLNHGSGRGTVKVTVPGGEIVFTRAEAEAVRAYFLSLPAHDLLRQDDEAQEQVAANHHQGEC